MSDLRRHQKNLQAVTELIKFSLGMDVFVVDDRMVAMAGTGPYRSNIGTKRPRDSYVDVTLNRGDSQIVTEPRYTEQCYRCEYRHLCPYSMVMCRPLARNNRIKGLIGFLGFSEGQRKAMIEHSSFLCELSEKLDYIWETDNLDLPHFLRHPGTRAFMDMFEEGLILTTPDYRVLSVNQRAEGFLRADSNGIEGEPLSRIIGECSPIRSGSAADLLGEVVRKGDYPLSDGRKIGGHVVVVSGRSKSRRPWKSCPLTTPAMSIIVGTSPAMIRLREHASNVALSSSTVLIQGETGVGKELVARYIHQMSSRWAGPFETVNCAAIPDSLFESEFFGYAPGAFTGAGAKGKAGSFQNAHGGTLFLDEISRLSPTNQAKILRVLEDGLVQRLGEEKRSLVDVRVLAATNTNLEKAVTENRFLLDLYYRLAVIPLHVPPLRERAKDVPLLLEYYQGQFQESMPHHDFRGFSEEAMDLLLSYHWPGNVRELKNVVEYVMNIVRGRKADSGDLPAGCRRARTYSAPGASDAPLPLEEAEMRQIRLALQTYGCDTNGKRRAARHLGVSLSTLYRKMSKVGLSGAMKTGAN
jgi:sigma-54 dependent transcriptional regulator, acetoin dehydrogenase operon transcriptional activator AcoR